MAAVRKFQKLCQYLQSIINKHAPFKPALRKKRRLLTKLLIAKELLDLIKQKQKLYVTHYVQGTEEQKCIYKQFANKLTKIKKNAKKQYLQDEIVNSGNSRKF